jgi:hypothetical protein
MTNSAIRRLAHVSLMLSTISLLTFLLAFGLAWTPFADAHWIRRATAVAWLIGPGSALLAILGLIYDSRRIVALVALIAATAIFLLETLQMLV